MSGKRLTGEHRIRTRTKAAELYVQGCTIASTGRQLEVSYGTARTLLLEADVRLRRPGGLRVTGFR